MSKVIMSVEIKGGIQEMTLYIHLILYPLLVGMFQALAGSPYQKCYMPCATGQPLGRSILMTSTTIVTTTTLSTTAPYFKMSIRKDRWWSCCKASWGSSHAYQRMILQAEIIEQLPRTGEKRVDFVWFNEARQSPWLATGKGTYSVISCAFQWWQGDTGLNTDWHILLKSAALEGVLMTCQHLGSQWSWWRTASYWHVAVRKELDEWSFCGKSGSARHGMQ